MQTHMTPTSPSAESYPVAPAARAVARQNSPRRGGFTLMEMLIVVIIIAILAGMVLGMFKVGKSWKAKADTAEKLGKLRAAIEEFNGEYGKYPPVALYDGVQPFYYEYAWTNGMSYSGAYTPIIACMPPGLEPRFFTFGLVSFLLTRNIGHAHDLETYYGGLFTLNQWTLYNLAVDDQPRDVAAIDRWSVQVAGIFSEGKSAYATSLTTPQGGSLSIKYTNLVISVYDGWGREFHYRSLAPYTSYRLWSIGQDGVDGTRDDISTGAGY